MWYRVPSGETVVEPGGPRGRGLSPMGTSVPQSTGCESLTRYVAPERVNFTGTVRPASSRLIAGGPYTGGRKPPKIAEVHLDGRSNASTPSVRLSELPWLALNPRPRFAKPRQISHWFAPPVSAMSAVRIAFRPSTNPGLHGWNFIPSITSWKARLFPPVFQAS